MRPADLSSGEVVRFRGAIGRRLGLRFDDSKLGHLSEVLARRADATGGPASLYVERLERTGCREELRALARELTIGETYFLRNREQFAAFSGAVLPERMAARGNTRRLRILSAGCASGEEPYSLAIAAREAGVEPGWDISIRAVDINPALLEKAARGRYSAWALRATPPEFRDRWFRPVGRDFVLDESLRAGVTFEERNLAAEAPDLWAPASYDVVFCRNVLMYFTPEGARTLVGRIGQSLVPGGFLFLGHAETLRGLSEDFHLRYTHGAFYYQRQDRLSAFSGPAPDAAAPAGTVPHGPLESREWADSWLAAVRRASERIRTLAEAPAAAPELQCLPGPGPEGALKQAVMELLREERYADAFERLRGEAGESACDPGILLLRAVLLAHGGRLGEAEAACRELLRHDESAPGARYLLALCREGLGDRRGAVEHDLEASFLDPTFAMPRLHLGRMARRAGDSITARRELGRALALLRREDPDRLLLFGGGFGREGLSALCRAELLAAGGCP